MNYLGPGLDLTDQLIDKHFDKLPTKIFDKDTYKPSSRRNSRRSSEQQQLESRRNSQQQDSSNSELASEDQTREVRDREVRDQDDRNREPSRRRREKDRRGTRELEDNPIPEVEEYDDIDENKRSNENTRDIPRYSGQGQTQAYAYMAGPPGRQYGYPPMPIYSNEPPRYRPQYVPTPPPGQGCPPPSNTYSPDRGRDRNYDSDDDFYAKPARSSRRSRPKAVTRRSSSYHGPRDRHDYNNSYGSDDGEGQMQHRRGSELGTMAKAKDAGKRYGIKEEVEDVISTSTAGLAGSAVGVVVGGWAANKAQVAYGKDKRRNESNPLLTLLGAAAGGLAVDVLVSRFEDQKNEAKLKERRWDKKFGNERDEGGRGSESGNGRRGSGRRRRRGSYSD